MAVPRDHGAGRGFYTVDLLLNREEIFAALDQIPDPEIPVISIVELGVIRDVRPMGKLVEVDITPTYSGCPAMKQMEDDVRAKLKGEGFEEVTIKTIYQPAWTTDWLNKAAREKLRQYGIAPPEGTSTDKSTLTGKDRTVRCPRCESSDTVMVSQFGSTACKALFKCRSCLEAFDYFKCI